MELKMGIFKSSLIGGFAVVAVTAFSSFAQARAIYWTGYAQGGDAWGCFSRASYDADAGARQSCVDDFRVSHYACRNAPVIRTENLGVTYDEYGNSYCSARVYIEIP